MPINDIENLSEFNIRKIHAAYVGGDMLPEESAEFEKDVLAGLVKLPRDLALLKSAQIPVINQGVLDAYNEGIMTPEESAEFEADIASGLWKMPGEKASLLEQELAIVPTSEEATLLDPKLPISGAALEYDVTGVPISEVVTLPRPEPVSAFAEIRDPVTGELRETEETRTKPDWIQLPELYGLNVDSAKAMFGSLLSNPKEAVQIIKANFPEVEVRHDEKGNAILKSAIDGQEYAMKPGMQLSDVPKMVATAAAFTPAGSASTLAGQVVGAALTQAGIEAAQKSTGGTFDVGEIPMAAAGAGIGYLAGKALAPGAGKAVEAISDVVPEEQIAGRAMTSKQLAGALRRATLKKIGGKKAIKEVLVEAAPDPQILASARRLGLEEFLQPDHVTTNQVFREVSQAVKSVPGSEARRAEIAGLKKIAEKADDIVNKLGGTLDLSELDVSVKQVLVATQDELDKKADKIYAVLKNKIKPKTPAPASNTIAWLENRIDELGGLDSLRPIEKSLYKKLSGSPSYALLDDTRKTLTAARVKKQGVFKDADTGLIKKLESVLLQDQQKAAEIAGALDIFNDARKTVAIRKGIESDLKALFGKKLDGTILKSLSTGVKGLSKGDISQFAKMLKAIPEDMREEVVASGLNTAFGKNAKNGKLSFNNFSLWYEGIKNNKQASNALFTNLPKGAKQTLDDLYTVSNGIRKATRERITTGRIMAVREELRGADNAIGQIYDVARKQGALSIAAHVGGENRGLLSAIASAVTKSKPDALKAADMLISSPEFIAAATDAKNIAKLAKTSAFKKFTKFLIDPRAQTNPERWLMSIFQARRQIRGD